MADTYTLEAQSRTVIGKHVKKLRRQDLIPAVVYGAGGPPVHVSCPRRPLEITLKNAGGTHLINLDVEGTTHNVLVREVQREPIKRSILHVDFLRVDLTKKLRTEIPVVFVGQPRLSSELQIQQNVQFIEVESLPTDIPQNIEVNISALAAQGDQITVADLPAIPNVEILSDPHEVLVRVEALAAEVAEEEVAAEVAAPAEPEVVEKGKKEEEEF
jgi:large subunit ribosomal protein L25